MLKRAVALVGSGVHLVALLALSDGGAPAFACTPDQFPDLLSVAISGGDIGLWAAQTAAAEQAAAPG